MISITKKSKSLILAASLLVVTKMAAGAPGKLRDLPLNLGTSVQPNILLLVDNSISMDWEILKSKGAERINPTLTDRNNLDFPPRAHKRYMIQTCALHNVLYYDPSLTYRPWQGKNDQNMDFANMDPEKVLLDPYDSKGAFINLTTLTKTSVDALTGTEYTIRPGYLPYTDKDSDGDFDAFECHDEADFANMNSNYVDISEMTDAERVNFANWYAYYRKRLGTVKAALGEVIDKSTARMGLAPFWRNTHRYEGKILRESNGLIIKDIDDISRPLNKDAADNKAALKNALVKLGAAGDTPFLDRFRQAGQYFDESVAPPNGFLGANIQVEHTDSGTVSNKTPILNKENGGSCQQNFTLAFSDGHWSGSLLKDFGDHDSDVNATFGGAMFRDKNETEGTLADIAMKYLANDLAPSLADELNVTDVRNPSQQIKHQHMTTYMVTFGVEGTAGLNPREEGFPGWPDIVVNTDPDKTEHPTKIDDVRHAAWNGRGEFLSARNPVALSASLNTAIADIQARAGTATSVSFNSGSTSNDTLVFQSRFDSGRWNGDMLAYRFDRDGVVDTDGNGNITIADALWSASDKLAAKVSEGGFAKRNIITYNGSQGVPFTFPDSYHTLLADGVDSGAETLSDRQIRDLLTEAAHDADTNDTTQRSENQTFGANIVDFIKGDASNELDTRGVGIFRPRNNKFLGAFIHSSPQFSGAPARGYPDLIEGDAIANRYSTYASNNADRRPLVFAGSSDGMLHAFDASTGDKGGEEVFAYIPGNLANSLHQPAKPDYQYHAYVDGTPTIGDVFVDKAWKTYLVGGLRSGGRGIYVLDITSPDDLAAASGSANAAKKVIVTEFTDNNLGYSFSRPQIARMNNGRWAAIFGNGYNNNGDGKARLFIVYLDKAGGHMSIEASESGVSYIANDDCLDAGSNCNGLSSPSLADTNGDAIVDRVYAGDVHGNLWAFDLSDKKSANWELAYDKAPLFTACTDASCTIDKRQPITTKPVVSVHPTYNASTAPNLMVYFGTGEAISKGAKANRDVQGFYGVWDSGVNQKTGANRTLTKADLQAQAFDRDFNVTNHAVNYALDGEFGWYVDLAIDGADTLEGGRSVTTPLLLGDLIFFLVSVPEKAICSASGSSYLAALNRFDGTRADFDIFDTDDDGDPDDRSPLILQQGDVVGIGNIDDKIVTTGSDGLIRDENVVSKSFIPSGRKAWSILR